MASRRKRLPRPNTGSPPTSIHTFDLISRPLWFFCITHRQNRFFHFIVTALSAGNAPDPAVLIDLSHVLDVLAARVTLHSARRPARHVLGRNMDVHFHHA